MDATLRRRFNPYNAVAHNETNCTVSNPRNPPPSTLPHTQAPSPAGTPSPPNPLPQGAIEPDDNTTKDAGGGVIAVTRALQVLEAFALGESSLALAELSRRCGLHKTTVLRLARTLAQSEIGRAHV